MFLLMYIPPHGGSIHRETKIFGHKTQENVTWGKGNTETVGESIIHLIKIAHTKDIIYLDIFYNVFYWITFVLVF